MISHTPIHTYIGRRLTLSYTYNTHRPLLLTHTLRTPSLRHSHTEPHALIVSHTLIHRTSLTDRLLHSNTPGPQTPPVHIPSSLTHSYTYPHTVTAAHFSSQLFSLMLLFSPRSPLLPHTPAQVQGVMFRQTLIRAAQRLGIEAGATNLKSNKNQVRFTLVRRCEERPKLPAGSFLVPSHHCFLLKTLPLPHPSSRHIPSTPHTHRRAARRPSSTSAAL